MAPINFRNKTILLQNFLLKTPQSVTNSERCRGLVSRFHSLRMDRLELGHSYTEAWELVSTMTDWKAEVDRIAIQWKVEWIMVWFLPI